MPHTFKFPRYLVAALVLSSLCVLVFPGRSQAATSVSEFAQFTGEASSDQVGDGDMANVGDVNGDGYEDFLVGTLLNDDAGGSAGAAYLIYGQPSLYSGTQSLSTVAQFTGEASGDEAGISVAGAGDVNGDGYDDFLIGADANDDAGSNAGAAYLIYGQPTPYSGTQSLSSAAQFTGEVASDRAGYGVSGVGDVNNDGYGDFIVGATYNSDSASNAGAVYLIYGQSTVYTGTQSLSTVAQFTGEDGGDFIGYRTAKAGDVNNDGYDDFLTATTFDADRDGLTYLIYGQSSLYSGTQSLSAVAQFTGEVAADRSGQSIASAGDVNNDGYDDFLIGAILNDDNASNAGAVYLIYGQATLYSGTNSLSTMTQFIGEAVDDQAGYSVAGAGDVNNDGYDDFLVGVYANDDAATNAGAVFLIYGQATLYTGTQSLSSMVEFTGEAVSDVVGSGVAMADMNGDGFDDILIGAYGNDDGASSAGAIYLGYLYIDVDSDGSAGNSGLLDGPDCNDTDSSISANQTYYRDADGDGFGISTVTETTCSYTPSSGYVTNSTDDDDTTFGDIDSVIINDDGTVTVTYANTATQSFDPFTSATNKFKAAVSTDLRRVVITNGKVVKVYRDGVRQSSKTIARRKPSASLVKLKVKSLYSNYNSIIVATARGETGKVTVLRLTSEDELTKKVSQSISLLRSARTPIAIATRRSKHRINVSFDRRSNQVERSYRLKRDGQLVEIY